MSFIIVIIATACFIGLILMSKGAHKLYRARQSVHWPRVPAIIVESRVKSSRKPKGKSAYKPKIAYSYQHAGESYTGYRIHFGRRTLSTSRAKAHALIKRYRNGQPIEIAHHPLRPYSCVLEPGLNKHAWLTFLSGFALMSLSVECWLLTWLQA